MDRAHRALPTMTGITTMKASTVIAPTSKGARIFLEGVGRAGQPYTVTYADNAIMVQFTSEGKRKVVASKGGVIDLQSQKVTRWAQGATMANIMVDEHTIFITRG